MARLVNKQFNSPIGLYSKQNIQDVLDRDTQILANGAVGIDFNNPTVGKPDNLKNSAVLRMLEEEERRQRNGYGPGSDRMLTPLRTWPPPEHDQKNQLRSTFKDVVTPGVKRVAWPPPHELGQESPYIEQNSVQPQGGPQYPPQSAGYQQNNQQPQSVPSNAPYQHQRGPLKLDVSQSSSSPLASPLSNPSPQGYRPATPSKGWSSVQSPVATPNQPAWRQNSPTRYQAAHQPVSQQTFLGQQYSGTPQSYRPVQNQPSQYQAPSQQYQPPQQQYQPPQQQYQAPNQQYQPPAQQYQSPAQQYQSPTPQYQSPTQQYQSPTQQYQSPTPQYQSPTQQYQSPTQQYQSPTPQYQSPAQQYQSSPQQYQAPTQQQYQTSQQQYQYSQQQFHSEQVYQSQPQYQSSQGQYQSVQSPQVQAAPPQVLRQASKPVEPPPSTITLRPQAPVSQAPPPVFSSQPATATLKVKISPKNLRGDLKWPPDDVRRKMYEEAENVNTSNSFLSIQGGKNLRGDLKWPPEEVKEQAAEENRLRLELAKGPVCRPRKVQRDYTPFFEQHALNSTYPGYKIPPGTQFYRPA